ncbi:MAG TPA: [Fe-Fe] hydrogenase large subunit C-terminal domain-containing protein, partial [Holophaga sp.]|nr:[Fe-Fe] hydrogenase large subunit C-terminal domain-containing protein [Holophaga sp.]
MYGAVYSELAQCQDCYRCIRECPVKAIRVSQSRAIVMQERCIACGACVAACPSGAKRVRDDIGLAAHLLETRANVIVSLAPSFVSEFEGIEPAQLIAALRRLGFSAVSETALGAQEVSARIAQELDAASGRIFISTACPVAVDLICKFHPAWVDRLTPVYSPLLAHAGLIR